VVAVVVGVHGIGQRQLGRAQLTGEWGPALQDGLEAAAKRPLPGLPFSFDLAYYGRLFLDTTQPEGAGAKSGADDEVLTGLAPEEEAELAQAAGDAAGEEALAAAEQEAVKGYTRIPSVLRVGFRALDWRFGPGAALVFAGSFREVRHYLRDPELKAAVDAVVDAAVGGDTRVLVGHSLGSVVAFEFVRRNPGRRLDLLVTLGSPLGARFVRALMPDPGYGKECLPLGLGAWVNVRDPHDPVAFAGDLARYWPRISDKKVNNGGDAHAVNIYLDKAETGAAVLAVLPLAAR
jgi:hypothetical protein